MVQEANSHSEESSIDPYDQALFNAGIDDFSDMVFDKLKDGTLDMDAAQHFFPKEDQD